MLGHTLYKKKLYYAILVDSLNIYIFVIAIQ